MWCLYNGGRLNYREVIPYTGPPPAQNDRFPEKIFLDGERLSGQGGLVFEGEALPETFFPNPNGDDTFHFPK